MKKTHVMSLMLISIASAVMIADSALAGWVSISTALPEADMRYVVCDPSDPKVIYAASEKRLYKTQNNGVSWEQVFMVWGTDNKVWSIYPDPLKRGTVYLACDRGVWRSKDFGKRWDVFFRGIDGQTSGVYCVTLDAENPDKIWLGTQSGLVTVLADSGANKKILKFPDIAVYSILMNATKTGPMVVLAADGIYQSFDRGECWNRVVVYSAGEPALGELPDAAAVAEESYVVTISSGLIYQPCLKKYVAATPKGVYVSLPDDLGAPKENIARDPEEKKRYSKNR